MIELVVLAIGLAAIFYFWAKGWHRVQSPAIQATPPATPAAVPGAPAAQPTGQTQQPATGRVWRGWRAMRRCR